jgi:hypothetical protein
VAIRAVSGIAQLRLKAASQNGVPDFSVLSIPVAQVNSLPAGKRKGVPMSGLGMRCWCRHITTHTIRPILLFD